MTIPATELEGPFEFVPATIPGVIEAENFDYGGQGVGYSDETAGNIQGVCERWYLVRKYSRASYFCIFVETGDKRPPGSRAVSHCLHRNFSWLRQTVLVGAANTARMQC